jgi:hypothetical protein
MSFNNRTVQRIVFIIDILLKSFPDTLPYSICCPSAKSSIARIPRTISNRQVSPWSTCSFNAEEPPIERIHFQEIHSTQTFAKEHAQKFLDTSGKWVVVTADRQTNGLGHQGRKWVASANGNLYATFVTLYPKNREKELFHIILRFRLFLWLKPCKIFIWSHR